MMLIHSILLTTKTIIFGLTNTYYNSLEYINIFFLLILSYVIAYHVITRPTTIHKQKKKNAIVNFKQYSKSSLNEDDAKNIALKINKYFQNEKVYLNPNISLKIVSQTLNIPSHHISETLNGLLGQSFNDFTNNYRIEEFKLLLQDKKFKNFSILALAFEVGFKSKATFNNSFKKFTKQTPSEYKKSISNNQ
nr:AraC family transcriptional regulator [uncultured Marinifilum sp.]